MDLFDPINRNWLLWSDDQLNAIWVQTTTNVAASGKTDPDGGTDAFQIDATDTSAFDGISQNFTRDAGGVTLRGFQYRIAMQAHSGSDIESSIGFRLLEVGGGAAVYTATSFKPVYGPGSAEIFSGGNKSVLVSGLSDTVWTVFEILWSLEDNPTGFADDLQVGIYPGGATTNFGKIHIFRPHIEDESSADGLGFRSRGQRQTEAISGPAGAPGATVVVRASTLGFTSEPNDNYPGGPVPALNLSFDEGLIQPANIGKSGWIESLVAGDGVIRTTISDVEFNNTERIRDHWKGFSFRDRAARLWRGRPRETFSQYEQIFEGTLGEKSVNDDSIRAPLRDPLHPLQNPLDRPKFGGFGQCLRFPAAADNVTFDTNPNLYIQGDCTIKCRVRFYDVPSIGPLFKLAEYGSGGGSSPDNASWRGMVQRNQMVWNHQHGAGSSETVSSGTDTVPLADFSDGDWHDALWMRDKASKTIFFYWDTILIGSGTYTTDADGGEDGFLIISGAVKVDVDEVMVWNRQLTEDEISGLAGTPIEAEKYWNDGLRGYYQADEGVGGLTWDSLSNRLDERRMEECYIHSDGADYMETTHHASLNSTGGDWTMEVRVAIVENATAFPIQIQKNDMYRVFYSNADNKIRGSFYLTGVTNAWVDLGHTFVYTPGQDGFFLFTARYTGSSRELAVFIEGVSKETQIVGAGGDALNTNSNNLFTFAGSAVPDNPMQGWISEVRLWDSAESDADIAARANTTLVGDETNLVLWWTIDETRADEQNRVISVFEPEETRYGVGKIFDRQIAIAARKNPSTFTAGLSGRNTAGVLQNDARFVGTGEGETNLEGQRKPYCLGEVFHAPLIEVDPLNNVYFANLPPMNKLGDVFDGGRLLLSEEISGLDDIWEQDFGTHPTKGYVRIQNVWVDNTTQMGSTASHNGDVTVLTGTTANSKVDDGLYVSFSERFTQLEWWAYSTLGNLAVDGALDVVLEWQFWNGELWDRLRGLSDPTELFRIGGKGDWTSNPATVSQLKGSFTKALSDGAFFNGVYNIRWTDPLTWWKDNLDNIHTVSGFVGAVPGDTTDRWWIRCAAITNPTGYQFTPRASAIWVGPVDAYKDSARGFVRFNGKPQYKPTCHVEGDTSEGSWAEQIPDGVKTVVNRFYPKQNYSYAPFFGDDAPDYRISRYAGLEDMSAVAFLGPVLAGGRTLLDADRTARLKLATFVAPEGVAVDGNITESTEQLLALNDVPLPDPPLSIDLLYRPHQTKMSDGDFNPIVPISVRKDVGAEWRTQDGAALLNQNDQRFLASVPIKILAYLARDGVTDGVNSELDKWVALLGPVRSAWQLIIPTGLIEDDIGFLAGLKITRYQIWHGVDNDAGTIDGPPFILFKYEENFANEETSIIVWGTDDADT